MTISDKSFSDHRFQRRKFSKFSYLVKPHPLAAMFFDRIKFLLSIFVECHLVTISAKLFSIMNTGFRGEDNGMGTLWKLVKPPGGHVF